MTPPSHALEIYVGPSCFASDEARAIGAELIRMNVPDLVVQVVDLSDPANVAPRAIFAVPTYVLDGRVVSLGNPFMDVLLRLLGSAIGVPLGGVG